MPLKRKKYLSVWDPKDILFRRVSYDSCDLNEKRKIQIRSIWLRFDLHIARIHLRMYYIILYTFDLIFRYVWCASDSRRGIRLCRRATLLHRHQKNSFSSFIRPLAPLREWKFFTLPAGSRHGITKKHANPLCARAKGTLYRC